MRGRHFINGKRCQGCRRGLKVYKNYRIRMVVGWVVAQTVTTNYPDLVSHTILIGSGPPRKNTGVPEKMFWERALKADNDLEDGYVIFFEPKSEANKKAAQLSFGRIAKRTEDLDTFVSKDCYINQRKVIEDFREDKYDILGKLNVSKIPILVLMGDHDICFHVEDWYPIVGKLPLIQLIVMPQAGHAIQTSISRSCGKLYYSIHQ